MTLWRWEHKARFLAGYGEQGEEANQGHAEVCTQVPGKVIHWKWGPGKRDSAKHLEANIWN